MEEQDIKKSTKKRWLWAGGIILLLGLYQSLTPLYREQEKALLSQIRDTVKESFPEQTENYAGTIGLFPYAAKQGGLREDNQRQVAVVLVHGLDDPGKVWQNLAPTLVNEDFAVWHLEYPNDQPIVESALLFNEELRKLRSLGVHHLTIVAHSMGGLVSRELLTSTTIGYSRALQQQQVPKVEELVMVGTPNHGSQMARFRILSELRDHLDRLLKGEALGLGFVLDGAGEAKIDLLPGSAFLTELNSRPQPEGVKMIVIAGITAPWSESDVADWLRTIDESIGENRSEEVQKIGTVMKSMSNGLGDGLVTLESARLAHVPFITVPGTHLSMIRNLTVDSERVPPAVPLIVRLLKSDRTLSSE